jgi:tetratricopeptide (TPR) repeat protein
MIKAAFTLLSLVIAFVVATAETRRHFSLPSQEATPFQDSLAPNLRPGELAIQGRQPFEESMTAAEMEFRAGEFDKAIDLCDAALRVSHGKYASVALTARGKAYARKGDLIRALQDFKEAVKEDSRNVEATLLALVLVLNLIQ